MLGAPTALLIGMGVAIGSGIFRAPGEVAAKLHTPTLIIAAWFVGGLIVLMQGMVTAELATRFPKAGGEYVFLREAYGEFVAFFFGWAYTVFIIGGGAATIASAFGEFTCELFGLGIRYAGLAAAAAIVAITIVNTVGLRAGAATQNVLTCLKILALIGIVVACFLGDRVVSVPSAAVSEPLRPGPNHTGLALFLGALLPILWSYDGTTDPVKMAEEVRGVRRAMPIACIGSAVALILLYVGVNLALMRIVPPEAMAGQASVPGEAMHRLFGAGGRRAALLIGMLVCLGSLSSTVLATIRVTFALARDGLTFRIMSRMSKSQAPVPALLVVCGFAVVLVLTRRFLEVLSIYFFAGTILFGLSYASLIVFRLRDHGKPPDAFRCPFGMVQATILIVLQLALAINIARERPTDALYTGVLLLAFGLLYFVWRRVVRQERQATSEPQNR